MYLALQASMERQHTRMLRMAARGASPSLQVARRSGLLHRAAGQACFGSTGHSSHRRRRCPQVGDCNLDNFASLSIGVINENQLAQPDLITIIERLRLSGGNSLFVEYRPVYAVEVFKVNLVALNDQLGVPASHACFLAAMGVGVDIRKDAADRVFTPDNNSLFALRNW